MLWLVVLQQLMVPALAAKVTKKEKFLAAYPVLFKFCLFWWCVIVFAIMSVYIIDHLLTKYYGPAKVDVSVERRLITVAGREAYWAQLVDPTVWSKETHPVMQSAAVNMVKVVAPAPESDAVVDNVASSGGSSSSGTPTPDGPLYWEDNQPKAKTEPVKWGPLQPGLALMLRHKEGDERAGNFFCTRECIELETPKAGPWRLKMRTVDVGGGYPFVPKSEESVVEVWAPEDDGGLKIKLRVTAGCSSRFFRWWSGLQKGSEEGADALLVGIVEEVERSKKKD